MTDFKRYGKYAGKVKKIIEKILVANPFKGVHFNNCPVIGISQQNSEEPQMVLAGAKFIPLSEVNLGELV